MRRRKNRRAAVLLAVLLLLVASLLGWWQRAARQRSVPFAIEQLTREMLSPSVRMAGSLRNSLQQREPATIATPVALSYLRELQAENRRLNALLGLRNSLPRTAIAATVIGRGNTPWQGYLTLDKGKADGVRQHMVVLTPEGVLGQINAVDTHTAQVLSLTDRVSGIGALLVRTRETGVLKGHRRGECRLLYLSSQADVKPGDAVITSGLGHIFPAGFPLGTIETVTNDVALSSKVATVRPAVDPARADYVLIIE